MKGTFTYFFDPLCGWCYGFSKAISQFYTKHKENYTFNVIPGGMVRGAQVGPIAYKRDLILGSYKRIEDMAEVTFGEPFLNKVKLGEQVINSDPPTQAFQTLKKMNLAHPVLIAKAVQKAIYFEGINPNNPENYSAMVKEFNGDINRFNKLFSSEEIAKAMHQDYYTSQQFQVQGFPYLILEIENEYYLIAQGFRTIDDLNLILEKAEQYHIDRKAGIQA